MIAAVTDTTGRTLEQFLKDRGRLFAWLAAWTVVAIGPSPTGLPHQPSMRSVGALVTELLPFDYSQFGSLPGVA